MYRPKALGQIVAFWGIQFKQTHPFVKIEGSPERTEYRIVIEAATRELYLLEKIHERKRELKTKIIMALDHLHSNKVPFIQPYLQSPAGEYFHDYYGGIWQCVPFRTNLPLDREKYLFEAWRGKAMAEFLIQLQRGAVGISGFEKNKIFSIKDYIYDLLKRLEKYNPEMMEHAEPFVHYLEKGFFQVHDRFPSAFGHGDLHPLNIIWTAQGIGVVIDWEFLGYKPEIYDAANLLGCLGMENPESLTGELVQEFVSRMRSAQIWSPFSWEYLFEFIVAIRFAWLSEWLRKSDSEMVAMELDYLNLLVANSDRLKAQWRAA
jgi:homoserine kinase type II